MQSKSKGSDVIVVGCGVIGLSCGIRLLEKQFDVTIVTRDLPPNTTSDVAAAVWYPYKAEPRDKVLEWGRVTYEELTHLSQDTGYGVSSVEFVELFVREVENPWWEGVVRNFRHTARDELPPGYVDGYTFEVPLIESSTYLRRLMRRFQEGGGTIEEREIGSLDELYRDNRLVVNCSGVWARKLAKDKEVYPIRGQVVIVKRPPGIKRCLVDEQGPLSLTYIVPRSKDCVLGGTAEESEGAWESQLQVNPDTAEEILRKCKQLEPLLDGAEVLASKVGLRPGRKEVRLELEPVHGLTRCGVIHNYGHGGSGFTLSWGCAAEVAELADTFSQSRA